MNSVFRRAKVHIMHAFSYVRDATAPTDYQRSHGTNLKIFHSHSRRGNFTIRASRSFGNDGAAV